MGFKPFTGAATQGAVNQTLHTTIVTLNGTWDSSGTDCCPAGAFVEFLRGFFQWGLNGAYTIEGPTKVSDGLRGIGPETAGSGAHAYPLGSGVFGYTTAAALASDKTYQFRYGIDYWHDDPDTLCCTKYGSKATFKTDAVTATTGTPAASGITSTGATISCTYSPNVDESSCSAQLQYKRNVDPGWTNAGSPQLTGGYGSTTVTQAISGLTASTLYNVRLVLTRTTNNGTSVTSTTANFTTLGAQPTVSTSPADTVSSTGATLRGVVNPNGISTTYKFQYGLTTAYGTTTGVQGPDSGSSPVSFSQAISGLTPNTTYHFRAMATQSAVDYFGADATFSTDTQGHIMPTTYSFLGKYGVQLDVYFCVEQPSASSSDRFLSAPTIWGANDVKVSKDGGATANTTNLPTRVGTSPLYKLTLTAAEMGAYDVNVMVVHTATPPSWRDCHIGIRTKLLLGQIDVDATAIGGNTSAMQLLGVGTGYGLYAKGSSGIRGEAQGTSGTGIIGVGIGAGHGVQGSGGTGGQPCNFFDTQEGAELTPGDLTDNMTMRQLNQLQKVRHAHKVTQTSGFQTWYRRNSTDILKQRVVSDDTVTQVQNKLY